MRAGDFSKLKDSSGNVIPIYDPRTGQQFPGNIIPLNRFNPVSVNIMNSPFYPVPNQGDPDVPYRNWHGDPNMSYGSGGSRIYSFRIDQRIKESDTVTFAYSHWKTFTSLDMVAGPVEPMVQGNVWGHVSNYQYTPSVGWTHIFSPRIVNEFRGALNRLRIAQGNDRPNGGELLKEWGIQGIDPGLTWGMVPWLTIVGLVGVESWEPENTFIDIRWNVIDNITMVFGKHSMKAGYNLVRMQLNQKGLGAWNDANYPYGKYYFDNQFTTNPVTGGGGDSWADFLLGFPTYASKYTARSQIADRGFTQGIYFQDDWKIAPRVTLNLGVRWELEGVPYDRAGLYYGFDPKTGAMVFPSQYALDHVSPLFNPLIPLELASAVGYPSKLRTQAWGNILPRLGIAYRPFNNARTVVRAGFGIYNDGFYGGLWRGAARGNTGGVDAVNTGGPFALTETATGQRGAPGQDPTVSFPNPWAGGGGGGGGGTYDASGANPNTVQGKIYQFNVAAEQELWGTAFRAAYIGHRSLNMGYVRDLNQVAPSTTPWSITDCANQGPLPRANCRRNYYGFGSVIWEDAGAKDYYDSMEFKVSRPMTHGLWLQAAWIWANSRGDSQGSANAYDLYYGWGQNDGLPHQRLTINWVYQLPFGKGKYFNVDTGNRWGNGIFDYIFGNWTVSGYQSFLGGTPFSVTYSGSDPSGMGITGPVTTGIDPSGWPIVSVQRPDRIASGKCDPAPCANGLWFDPSAFVTLPSNIGRFGNSGRNILRGPAGQRTTMAVYKEFPIWETFRARIMATLDNPFNMHGYRVRSWNISDPANVGKMDAGQPLGFIGGNSNYARGITLDAKLFF